MEIYNSGVIALCFMVAMVMAWQGGWWIAQKERKEPGRDPGNHFADASLALLGLLLGFTFSMSLGKHDQRRLMVVAESNALGDFYTCATLLKDPHRSRLQESIRDYAREKLAITKVPFSHARLEQALQKFQSMQATMTAITAEAISDGTPIANALANTLNEVTSSQASRLAAFRDRLANSIVLVLFLGCMIPFFLMGQKQMTATKPHLTAPLIFMGLITLVIYVTLDLNQPQRGFITVSQEPLERLIQSISK